MNPVYLTVLEICGDYARLRSDDGDTFSGYKYCLWSEVEAEYSKSDYVTWNEEYVTADNLYIID